MRSGTNVNLFRECTAQLGEAATSDEMLRCFSDELANDTIDATSRQILLTFSAALVFFMQAGFAMVCAGAIRK